MLESIQAAWWLNPKGSVCVSFSCWGEVRMFSSVQVMASDRMCPCCFCLGEQGNGWVLRGWSKSWKSLEDGSYISWAQLLCQHQPVKPLGRTAESQQLQWPGSGAGPRHAVRRLWFFLWWQVRLLPQYSGRSTVCDQRNAIAISPASTGPEQPCVLSLLSPGCRTFFFFCLLCNWSWKVCLQSSSVGEPTSKFACWQCLEVQSLGRDWV